jgi:hypothetical protein
MKARRRTRAGVLERHPKAIHALIVTDLGLDTELAAQPLELVQECACIERHLVLLGTPSAIVPQQSP